MRYEYCEKDIGEMEDRIHATEAKSEAMERFCPPVSKVEAVTPDNMYWHELLTAAAALLEQIHARDGFQDDQTRRLAALYREQAEGFSESMKFPPLKFVRGA